MTQPRIDPPLWPSGAKPHACEGCPYEKRKVGAKFQFVAGHGPRDARLAIIAEAPGRHEVGRDCGPACVHPEGQPLVGPSGAVVDSAGCGRSAVFLTNIRKCVPPEKEEDAARTDSIAHCVRAYLLPEIAAFGAEWRRIHLLGAEALEAWTGLDKIGKYHGSCFTRAEVEALRAVAGEADRDAAPEVADVEEEDDDSDEDVP